VFDYYFELRDVRDSPRPFGFAVRATCEIEYYDWIRSIEFCIRHLKRQDEMNRESVRRLSIRNSDLELMITV